MPDEIRCPICKTEPVPTAVGSDVVSVDCTHCGLFSVSGTTKKLLPTLIGADTRKAALVSYTLRRMQSTEERPLLTSDGIQRILETGKLPSPDAQADNLIRLLG